MAKETRDSQRGGRTHIVRVGAEGLTLREPALI